MRTYSELTSISSFYDRYKYLRLGGAVGRETFGYDRYLNQGFYTSSEWRRVRNDVIARDEGFDLGHFDFVIPSRPIIHHMNPMTVQDLVHGSDDIVNPEYLITCTHRTHNAIHYGDESLLPQPLIIRRPGDTTLW